MQTKDETILVPLNCKEAKQCEFCGKQPFLIRQVGLRLTRTVRCCNEECDAQPQVLGSSRSKVCKNWNSLNRAQ